MIGPAIYFIPDAGNPATVADIQPAGIAYAFPAGRCSSSRIERGPSGSAGVLLSADAVQFQPDVQQWSEFDTFWFGFEPDRRPGPATFARADMAGGNRVKLADGNEWIVPVVREFHDGSTGLPQEWVATRARKFALQPMAEYAELYGRGCALFDSLEQQARDIAAGLSESEVRAAAAGAGDVTFNVVEGLKFFADVLAVNYRVSIAEIGALRLLNEQNEFTAIGATVDFGAAVGMFMEIFSEAREAKKNGVDCRQPAIRRDAESRCCDESRPAATPAGIA